MSLDLIEALHIPRGLAVIDIGSRCFGARRPPRRRGFSDLTALDISASAQEEVRSRFGASAVLRLHEDLLDWQPDRRYDLWHDRAVFHFLVGETDRRRYLETMHAAMRPRGFLILATFALDGPEFCSGLPVVRYSAEDLSLILGDTFEPLETRREIHTTPKGTIQPFTWWPVAFARLESDYPSLQGTRKP